MSSKTALLEVIALGAEDAQRAQEGGADRLELVADMASDGLTPRRRRCARCSPPPTCPCG